MNESIISLPPPRNQSKVSLEQALLRRRSGREYREVPLTLAEISQLLWAGLGITDPSGARTAPSAGALFPMEIDMVAGAVADLAPAIYRYVAAGHGLKRIRSGDKREELCLAAFSQVWVKKAAVTFVVSGPSSPTVIKYGSRGLMYVHLQAGHVAQNMLLQATALDLASVPVAAFEESKVRGLISLPDAEQPLYLILVGRK